MSTLASIGVWHVLRTPAVTPLQRFPISPGTSKSGYALLVLSGVPQEGPATAPCAHPSAKESIGRRPLFFRSLFPLCARVQATHSCRHTHSPCQHIHQLRGQVPGARRACQPGRHPWGRARPGDGMGTASRKAASCCRAAGQDGAGGASHDWVCCVLLCVCAAVLYTH